MLGDFPFKHQVWSGKAKLSLLPLSLASSYQECEKVGAVAVLRVMILTGGKR